MFDVAAFLDRARRGAGDVSDYRIAQLIGLTRQGISKIRSGSIPSDAVALRLCEYSGDDPEHVLACLQSMRASNDDEAEVWQRIADRLRRRSLALFVAAGAVAALSGPSLTETQTALLPDDPVQGLSIMSSLLLSWLLLVSLRRPAQLILVSRS